MLEEEVEYQEDDDYVTITVNCNSLSDSATLQYLLLHIPPPKLRHVCPRTCTLTHCSNLAQGGWVGAQGEGWGTCKGIGTCVRCLGHTVGGLDMRWGRRCTWMG